MDYLQSTTSTLSSVEGGRRDIERLSLEERQRTSSACDSLSSLESSERRAKEKKSSRRSCRSKHKSQQTKQALAAETADHYYSECYMHGVGVEAANHAARAVQENYRKYWLQKFDHENTRTAHGDDGCLHPFLMRNISPPEHTSTLVEKDATTLQRGATSLPNIGYFAVTDTHDNLNQLGETANTVLMNEEKTKTRTRRYNATKHITTPPVEYVCMHNEKKRDYIDFRKYETFVPQKLSGTRKSDSKEISKQTQLGHEQEGINYNKASLFEKYMNKAKDFVHTVSDSTLRESFTNYPSKNTESESGSYLTFQQLDEELSAIITSRSPLRERQAKQTENAKLSLIHALAVSGGDVKSREFLFALDQLRSLFVGTSLDARVNHNTGNKPIEGTWLCLSRPHFKECLGENSAGEYVSKCYQVFIFAAFFPLNLIQLIFHICLNYTQI